LKHLHGFQDLQFAFVAVVFLFYYAIQPELDCFKNTLDLLVQVFRVSLESFIDQDSQSDEKVVFEY